MSDRAAPPHRLLERAAERSPHSPAIRDADTRLTYAETAAASRRLAGWLLRNGVRPGGRVLVRHPNAAMLVPLLHAVTRAGAVFTPVSPSTSDFQLRPVVADAEPDLIVSTVEEAAALRALGVAPVVPLPEVVARSADCPDDDVDRPGPHDLAFLIYTSGSTATPKGVMCAHRQVAFAVEAIASRLRYGHDDAVLCRLPLSFDYGLYQPLLCAHGGSELLLPPESADAALLRVVRDWRATVIPVVPALATMLIGLARRGADTAAVRLFTNTGAAMSPTTAADLRRHFPNARVRMMYGITECKRVSIAEPDEDLTRPGSAGRPLDGTAVTITDDDGAPLPPGSVGEIVVSGPHVTDGYWRAPELTARRFADTPAGRVLRTGDRGWLDADGHLYFAGRHDDVFKRRGVRVSTTEIEAAAMSLPGVRAAAVPRPDDHGELAVYVVGDVTADDVLAGLDARLERAKAPDVCRVLPALPLTANGKVDKTRLAGLADTGPSR